MNVPKLLIDPFQSRHARSETGALSIRAYHAIMKVEGTVRSTIGWFKEWHAKRRAIAELEGLSDSLLHDIGIERSQIVAAINDRWTWIERPAGGAATALRPVLIGRLEELPSCASNDDGVDAAA